MLSFTSIENIMESLEVTDLGTTSNELAIPAAGKFNYIATKDGLPWANQDCSTHSDSRAQAKNWRRKKTRGDYVFQAYMALPAPHHLNAALSLSERLELANRTYHVGLCYGFQWAIVEGLRCFWKDWILMKRNTHLCAFHLPFSNKCCSA